ncbi:MAG: hypothetical protein HY842_17780 [Bacteroidetes bacterium]|nr:hypothetical protein [Bacteroidota bacterium]
MKKLILPLFILLAARQIGLAQKSKKPNYFLSFQGALLYDKDPRNNYLGVGLYKIGWSRQIKNTLSGIDIEFIKYKSDFQRNPSLRTNIMKKRTSFELYYYKSYLIFGDINNGLFTGPSASIMLTKTKYDPGAYSKNKKDESCQCFGIGGNMGYIHKLNRTIQLLISTRFTLMDVGIFQTQGYYSLQSYKSQYKREFNIEFLRSQFQFMAGFSFKL